MRMETFLVPRSGRRCRLRPCLNTLLGAEALESRQLLSTYTPTNLTALNSVVVTPAVQAASQSAVTNPTPQGQTPAQIRTAYGFSQVKGDGTGQTIAIIDAFNDPNLASDLNTFDKQFGTTANGSSLFSQYGSASSFLTAVNQSGGNPSASTDAGWALETSLDVEWAHAIAPGAKILLVEANSGNLGDLLSAVDYARHQPGVSTVSMSWGASEFLGETSLDGLFTTPAGHPGVTFVAAAGDDGGLSGANWPAASPNVLSVGGTTLQTQSNGTYAGESAWTLGGGGFSVFEPEPAYQTQAQQTGVRTTPDVAYNADPNTGFAVYDSLTNQGQSGWFQVGGTSAGAPQWAALVAVADQSLPKGASLDGAKQTLPALYGLAASSATSSAFHDVSSGNSFLFRTRVGYDLATGLGSPTANQLIPALAGGSSSPAIVQPQVRAFAAVSTATGSQAPLPSPSSPQDVTSTSTSLSNPAIVVVLVQSGNQVVAVAVPLFPTTLNLTLPSLVPPATHIAPSSPQVEVPPAQLAVTPISDDILPL
ncbi:MAG TPA: S53 family peptidase, partial [Isosphaeraceae bacterium]|nr:S53 family peptidase [Isosphaeraceae bacterium]